MDEPPPSYNEAIRQKDWLEIVAPYVDVRDYGNICRVSQRFYAVFAIRLWKDPLSILRKLRRNTSTGESSAQTSNRLEQLPYACLCL